jgi:hypothetical protein
MADIAVVQTEPLLFDDVPVSDLGTISIRVFVLPPKPKKGAEKELALPLDVQEGEEFLLDQQGATPVSSYLESGRGKRCVVYLVNGQRQEFGDNGFIVQDLGFRYLRARMMIMVDVDGLAPEAVGKMMQGSRQGFYRGAIFEAITKRIVATLKDDPDLVRLEEEAEEAVSELSAGDEKVKQTLDQLIDSHHDKGHNFAEGSGSSAGDSRDGDELGFKIVNKAGVVMLLPPDAGQAADYPVLMSQPASSIIRIRPNQPREIGIKSIPSGHWAAIGQFNAESDTRVLELNVKKEKLDDHGKLTLTFTESEGFDTDQYPVRATVKVTARFNGIAEPRQIELAVLIKPDTYRPDPVLLEDPMKLKVTSREPVRLRRGENDTHVRLRWDGKDCLLTESLPKWKLSAKLVGDGKQQPKMNFSDPLAGRFSLLISPRPEWQAGDRLKFEVTADGPGGRELLAVFDADVIDPAPSPEQKSEKGPRLVDGEFKTGSMRRPPYQLKVIKRDEYAQRCWDAEEWTDEDAGAFLRPTDRAPLILIINEDMAALRDFKKALTKRNTEQDVQRKVNKYTSHIAFHLYQMYQATQGKKDADVDAADRARREEVHRVAMTMIKLMDVAER